MTEILIMVFSTIGALFILSSAIGMLTKPDVYLRISVMTKAATLGIGLTLTSAALFFDEYSVTTRVVAIILFVFLTAPVGGHMLARAAYFTKTKVWKGTKLDELDGHYDQDTHALHSELPGNNTPPSSTNKIDPS